jgi:hypothetical protein
MTIMNQWATDQASASHTDTTGGGAFAASIPRNGRVKTTTKTPCSFCLAKNQTFTNHTSADCGFNPANAHLQKKKGTARGPAALAGALSAADVNELNSNWHVIHQSDTHAAGTNLYNPLINHDDEDSDVDSN